MGQWIETFNMVAWLNSDGGEIGKSVLGIYLYVMVLFCDELIYWHHLENVSGCMNDILIVPHSIPYPNLEHQGYLGEDGNNCTKQAG